MSTDTTQCYDTVRIEGTDELVWQYIEDQAKDLVDAWRELVQNGVDDPMSTWVKLWYDDDHTVVSDNGSGMELDEQTGRDLLTNLGESSKARDDDETIGQFGVGIGQALAQARLAAISGEQVLLFAIEEMGLDVIAVDLDNVVDVANDIHDGFGDHIDEAIDGDLAETSVEGMTVVLDHYEDKTPNYSYKWNNFEDDIVDRFEYCEIASATRVYVNDDRISDSNVAFASRNYAHVEEYELSDGMLAHIGVYPNQTDDLDVYSNGIHVTNVDNQGLSGVVVTEGNLDLNFARNEIKSGCVRWDEISDRLDEIRMDLFGEIPEKRLNAQAREFLANRMFEDEQVREQFADVALFRTAGEDYTDLETVEGRDTVCTARLIDQVSDKLEEGLGMVVLDESDGASERLIEAIETDPLPDEDTNDEDEQADVGVVEGTQTVDATEKAESMGMHTSHERLPMGELTPVQRQKLMIAREIADRLPDDRKVYYGESDVLKAWTDGHDYVVITDTSTSSNAWTVYVPELFRQVVHELAHTSDTTDDPSHGHFFESRYRDLVDDEWDVLSSVLEDVKDDGLETVAQQAPKY